VEFKARGSVPGADDNYVSNRYGQASIQYRVDETTIYVKAPDPWGDPTLGQNEYVMLGGGTPFVIPCAIGVIGGDPTTLEQVRQNAAWSLSRGLPGALSAIANGSNGSEVFPQFRSDQGSLGPVLAGLGFSTLNGLPGSNGAFGARDVQHHLEGSMVGVSAIEVFYASDEASHPPGGPPGYAANVDATSATGNPIKVTDHSITAPVPNWVYYYHQVAPGSVPVEYVATDTVGGYFDPQDPDHVHICTAGHSMGETYLFKDWDYNRNVYALSGIERTWGIDTWVRILAHETKHKEIWDMYGQSMKDAAGMKNGVPDTIVDANGITRANDPDADPDGDGLPTSYEVNGGLDPMERDTTRFGQNDGEFVAYRAMDGKLGSRPQDWASDGLNRFDPYRDPRARTQLFDKYRNFVGWTYGD
jgi:hypothetical protein